MPRHPHLDRCPGKHVAIGMRTGEVVLAPVRAECPPVMLSLDMLGVVDETLAGG